MYVRFVGPKCDHSDGPAYGFFHFFYDRCEGFDASKALMAEMQDEVDWFKANLPVPNESSFDTGRRVIEESVGLSWFREDATEALSHAYKFKALLEEACVPIRVLRTVNPGLILFEDNQQVIARPTKAAMREWY